MCIIRPMLRFGVRPSVSPSVRSSHASCPLAEPVIKESTVHSRTKLLFIASYQLLSGEALSKAAVRPSVCRSFCPMLLALYSNGYYRTLIGNPVPPISEAYIVNVSKPSEMELRVLIRRTIEREHRTIGSGCQSYAVVDAIA